MPDTDETTAAVAEGTQEGAAPSGASPKTQDADGSQDDDASWDGEFDPERAKRTIEKLRPFEKQAKKLERDLQAAQKKIEEYENANKSELERLQAERDKLKAENDAAQAEIRAARATLALTDAGVKPKHAELLAGRIPAEAFESDGDLTKAVNSLKKEFPDLFRAVAGSADGGASGKTPEPTDMNALIRGTVRA